MNKAIQAKQFHTNLSTASVRLLVKWHRPVLLIEPDASQPDQSVAPYHHQKVSIKHL